MEFKYSGDDRKDPVEEYFYVNHDGVTQEMTV